MPSAHFSNALKRAQKRDLTVIELVGAAETIKQTDGLHQVAALYKAWIDHNAKDPLLYAVLFNYSAVVTELGEIDEAEGALERSLKQNPDFVPSSINLGRIYERKGKIALSVTQWSEAVQKLGQINGANIYHKITALNQMARVLEAGNQDEPAESMLRQSFEIDTTQREVAQHYIAVRQRECNWPIVQPWDRVSRSTLMKGISPLSIAVYTDDPMLQLATSAYYNKCDVGFPASGVVTSHWAASKENKKKAPLRIGYLSSDLREHAIGFLMSEVFELHNRKQVEVTVYYCGIKTEDKTKARIQATVDHWVDITEMDDPTAARRIADDGIQILVDVNAYTRDGRPKLLALRPAPVIVNWLGFPGSTASPYHHYIIADDWIIPPENEVYFSEKVLRLPCYQPNDRKRALAPKMPTRQECNLPKNAMVYCCFNGTQKISRFTFERWLTILNRVPKSVLWLLGGTETSQNRLRDRAKEHGIEPERLIFADKRQNAAHLARYPLADLFLDTAPYGAHTTASDALWMGVPVLTLSGRSFASRVCGSLVRSAGLAELACTTPDEYVDRAVALGRDKEALQNYRDQLAATRDTCDLFNTPLLVERLEDLYKEMWKDFKDGKLPRPDLHNLDVYLEIGSEIDHEAEEIAFRPDYEAWWIEKLAAYHAHRPLLPDNRLWTEETIKNLQKKTTRKK